jgi:hypothetical protein
MTLVTLIMSLFSSPFFFNAQSAVYNVYVPAHAFSTTLDSPLNGMGRDLEHFQFWGA